MAIGLVGAQRVGKTTLAREFAKEQGITFLQTDVSGIFRALRIDPLHDQDLATQLGIQTVILEGLTQQYERAQRESKLWITDRTPIDMAGYMLAVVARSNCLQPGLSELVLKYVQDCMDTANRFFSLMVLVQPGIPVVEKAGSAPGIPAYQEHLNSLMFGLLMDERLSQRHSFIKREFLDLEIRKRCLSTAAARSLETHRRMLEIGEIMLH